MMMKKNKNQSKKSDAMNGNDMDHRWNFNQIMKDVQAFGASHMSWKDKKELENRKVVNLGGKPPKKQRLPLSVARVQMKKQKEREEKILEENMILGRFGGKLGGNARRSSGNRKPKDRVLRSTEGHFRNGVLDVKHMLHPAPSRDNDSDTHMFSKGMKKKKMKKGSGKNNQGGGKRKGGGRKHH